MRRLLRQDEAEKRYGRDGALGALMFANSWQAVADVARQRLQRLSATPQRVDDIMKLWLVRLVALERLRLVDVIRTELQRLGDFDATDLRFEAHPEAFPGRSGSMVAFELRVFVARLPALTGHIHEAITGLYGLIYQARKLAATTGTDESKQDETALWPSRVAQLQLGVVNLLIELKDFRLAAAVLKGIAAGRMDDANVLSALGRVHLQVGNVPDARWCFDRVEALLLGNKAAAAAAATTTGGEVPDAAGGAAAASSWTVEDISRCARPDLVLANRAFVCMAADGDWESACRHLTDLINLVPGHPVAVNNLAVCHLYTGNVGQALSFLESLSIEMPAVAGNCPALLFNLATLFDLADQSADRKRRMLGTIVAAGAGDDLDPSCLKM